MMRHQVLKWLGVSTVLPGDSSFHLDLFGSLQFGLFEKLKMMLFSLQRIIL
jgi:hypothetical protein